MNTKQIILVFAATLCIAQVRKRVNRFAVFSPLLQFEVRFTFDPFPFIFLSNRHFCCTKKIASAHHVCLDIRRRAHHRLVDAHRRSVARAVAANR